MCDIVVRKVQLCYDKFLSVLRQEIGFEERLWNDAFCVRSGVKP